MTQQARDVSIFGLWVDHFERNDLVHARTDAAIEFEGRGACDGRPHCRRRRTRFIRDVLADFAKVVATVQRC
jgi:hypothetical protein